MDEYFQLQPGDIDVKMGTLSKGLGTCGGYLAGDASLINYLRYSLPGFMFSVGLSPVLAASCLKSLEKSVSTTVVIYNQGCLTSDELAEFLKSFALDCIIIGDGTNAGSGRSHGAEDILDDAGENGQDGNLPAGRPAKPGPRVPLR